MLNRRVETLNYERGGLIRRGTEDSGWVAVPVGLASVILDLVCAPQFRNQSNTACNRCSKYGSTERCWVLGQHTWGAGRALVLSAARTSLGLPFRELWMARASASSSGSSSSLVVLPRSTDRQGVSPSSLSQAPNTI